MLDTILGGIVIALVSGIFGKYLGERGKVTNDCCSINRAACQRLILEKLDNLDEKLESLTRVVNNKVLGL